MADHGHEPTGFCLPTEGIECLRQRICIQGAEAFVERFEPTASAPREFHHAQGQGEACEKRLSAGEGLDSSREPGQTINDLEFFGEAIPVPRHRTEQLGGDG